MRRLFLAAVFVVVGCNTVPNPRSCIDGTCTSEEFPFCDVNGTFGEEPGTCIAVTCEPNTFAQCRADIAVTCNATGNDYDLLDCPLGCVEGIGCRACEPNQTVCASGMVQACGPEGEIVSSETCSVLGCFESEPRCRNIDVSNNLSQFMDMIANPTDLDLDGVEIDTFEKTVRRDGMIVAGVNSFTLPAPPNGSSIFVIVAKDVHLSNVRVKAENTGFQVADGPAFAIVAHGSIRVSGPVTVVPGVGAKTVVGCAGEITSNVADPDVDPVYSGNGGGGFGTAGAKGGDVENRVLGGAGGGIVGTDSLIPLRGGCGGRRGGGALQLSSNQQIEIDALIDIRGLTSDQFREGGGSGGALLIEAPRVKLGANAKLLLLGGAGTAGDGRFDPAPVLDGSPMQGLACANTYRCGRGGNGASAGVPATPGENTVNYGIAGGGGGGLGRIRINTPDLTYAKTSTTLEAGVLTTGVISTR